ncbi:MAG: UDP-N-acetylmuramoyl-L-alanine--D-glutamate ligase [Myxococcota bacterium]|jgi:UDP-N-acetylmuramoylalanine--D-glutamate ligase|nr:UDP-N-acetylmuramoyl-L-alanine--D-glutamate ligase [Myxococcota bacterium]
MKLAGQRVLILGLGISGRSAANFCAARGAEVLAADEAPREKLAALDTLAPEVALQVGQTLPDVADFDLVVPSPGVPRERYAERARKVIGDIELASRFLEVPIVAVTGTNGKSTTVTLVEAMLRAGELRARIAGNVGTPALSLVGEPLDVAVLEVSSFQLEAVETFAPRVAAVLNVTPDHLDRHGSMEVYAATKARIFARQGPSDTAVLNHDDTIVRGMASACKGEVRYFSTRGAVSRGACLDGGTLALIERDGMRRVALDGTAFSGGHALANLLAAVSIVTALGVDPARAIGAACDVAPLPHRCEDVATRGGVRFVNDSKATNPGAAAQSLESFAAPIHWLAGGSDKGIDFSSLADAAQGRVACAYLYGETAAALADVLDARVETRRFDTLDEALEAAAANACASEVVLLAPACASFDQFKNFEERGEHFRRAVEALPSNPPDQGETA